MYVLLITAGYTRLLKYMEEVLGLINLIEEVESTMMIQVLNNTGD